MINMSYFLESSIVQTAGLALSLLAGSAGMVDAAALHQEDAEVTAGCGFHAEEIGAEPWVRTELFFGTARPDGTMVSDAEWEQFLDTEITPRFPEGLTVLSGAGQWQEDDDSIVEERSKIVILLYPRAAIEESHTEIEEIRAAYEREFQQESVLRADDDRPVCASF
jgi:hypothetical protein